MASVEKKYLRIKFANIENLNYIIYLKEEGEKNEQISYNSHSFL